ncbi:MAG TPA: RNase adapter RapZ [Nitrospiraceae bacterium]|nr:RNase adapter RapZ [Nitrospiraceae bacterium]
MSGNRMVIVTGLSGSGRSAALKAFEDIGYYCTDNLPLQLLAAYVEFAEGSAEARLTAIGIDVREKGFPKYFPKHLADLTGTGRTIEVLFLEATDQALVRRFSETRRPHPLARGTTPLLDGIRRERDALGEVKGLADRVIDTSDYTVHDLRQAIERHYAEVDAGRPLVVTIVSFGYKFGIPYDLDLLFDLRFLPNPHFVEALKPRTGEDPEVSRYVLSPKESEEFVARFLAFLTFLLPRYRTEGKSYLTIGFGCTGGRHRSVAVSLAIAESLRTNGYEVIVKHRDIG